MNVALNTIKQTKQLKHSYWALLALQTLEKSERAIKNEKSRHTGNFGLKIQRKDSENEEEAILVSSKTSAMLLIVMSVIENRTNIRKRKRPLPVRIADHAIFVAMTSTYKVLKGSPSTPTVRLNSNLGQLSSFWRHRSNRRGKLIHVHHYYIIDTSINNLVAVLVVIVW